MTDIPITPGSPFEVLKQLHRWVGWKWETRKGKRTKPPVMPGNGGRYASVSDPSTWGSHDDALATEGIDGVGLVLTDHPNLAACDLDHCRDAATGEIEPWAQRLIEQAQSYAEITPSAAGLRVIGLAEGLGRQHFNVSKGPNGAHVEVYCGGADRYITVSGDILQDWPLGDITAVIRALMTERAGAQQAMAPTLMSCRMRLPGSCAGRRTGRGRPQRDAVPRRLCHAGGRLVARAHHRDPAQSPGRDRTKMP